MPDPDIFDAIRTGDAYVAERLLAADPTCASARNEQGVSALMAAWYSFNPRLRAMLLERARDLDIFEAAMTGDAARVAALLAADSSLAAVYSADGFTALHFAGFFDQPDVGRILIAAAAPLDAVTRNDLANMPLHAAAAGRSLDVCRLLLEAGANPNATQHGGFTALHEAAHDGNEALAELLLAHGASQTLANDDGKIAADVASDAGHVTLARRLQP